MNNNFIIPGNHEGQKLVEMIWETDKDPACPHEMIIPSGKVEVIFNFSDDSAIEAKIGGDNLPLPRCFINGYNTNCITLHLQHRQIFFGVHLSPHSIKQLFAVPAGEFANSSVDLTLVDKTISELWYRMREAKTFIERVAVFKNWMNRKTFRVVSRETPLHSFLGDSGNTVHNPSSLSKLLFYSPRQLSRKLIELTGMSSEEYLQYKRYLHSMHLLHFSKLSLTEIGYESDFFDQSHFIRVFRQYSGFTPGEYRKLKSHLPGHIFY